MRHFDHLAKDVREALFHQLPQPFDRDSARSTLAHALGATLYVPATKDDLAGAVIALGVAHDARDRERRVHHEAVHAQILAE